MTLDRPDLTTTDDDGLAIIATHSGALMWVTNETDEEAALAELADEIGENSLTAESFGFRYIPEDEMDEWADASAQDYPA